MKFIYWPVWAVFAFIGWKVIMHFAPETVGWMVFAFFAAGTFAGFMTIAAEAQVDKRITELVDERIAAREKGKA